MTASKDERAGFPGVSPSLFAVSVLILIVGVILPVVSMIAKESMNSIHGVGAARRYLAALLNRSELEPERFAREGVSIPPWVVFINSGNRTTDKWKADMVAAVARIAPANVSITDSGTGIRMTPRA